MQHRITSFFSSSDSSLSSSIDQSESDSIPDESQLNQPAAEQAGETEGPSKRLRLAADHHRRSGFDHTWKKKHIWLSYDEDTGMFCKLCTKYSMMPRNGSGKWITTGCMAFRHDKVLAHENSAMHKEAVRARADEARAAVSGGVRAALEDAISHERRAVVGALKCVYFLVKSELPHTTNFSGLLDLAISLGCDYLRNLRQGGNASYRSDQIIAEFVQSLYDCVNERVLERMHKSDSISLMIDESTDVAILKQLVIYGRGVVNGKLECHFLEIKDLADGTASSIEKAILDFLHCANFDIADVSSFGSDGASVMTGRKSGVAARLQRLNKNIISIHCIAHRLALAAGQASESIPYLRRFKEILSSLFYFYHNSPVRQAGLTAIQNLLGDPILRLKQAKDVHWLSHNAAVEALRRSLVSVLHSLDREAAERSEPTASGLLGFIRTYFFIASLSVFADVLPHLSKLSRTMQNSSFDFSIFQPVIDSCIRSIESQQVTPGRYLSEVDDLLTKLREADHPITVTDERKAAFENQVRKPYLTALIRNLHDRFPAVDLITAFSIFNPTMLPETQSDRDQYGTSELEILLHHYSSGTLAVDRGDATTEWRELKEFLVNSDLKKSTIKGLGEFLLCSPERQQLFPTLSKLLVRGLILPLATADCERGFSTLKRIKTSPRNRLKNETLKQLMMISIEGLPPDEFDFARAADKWGSRSNCRIHWQS